MAITTSRQGCRILPISKSLRGAKSLRPSRKAEGRKGTSGPLDKHRSIERFHQTLKKSLAKQEPATTKRQLQAQLDRFVAYYNERRPHRGIGRRTPMAVFSAREKAYPCGPRIDASGYRVRRDKVDKGGGVTLRHQGRLHHIGVGRAYRGWRVILLVAGRGVQVLGVDGAPLRRLTLDPETDYQRMH